MLNSGDVAMSMIWAATGVMAAEEDSADFTVNMDGQMIEIDLFRVPNTSWHKDEAIACVQGVSGVQAFANMHKYLLKISRRDASLALLSDETPAAIPKWSSL